MKLHNHFATFLDEEVNLNTTRLGLLTASVEAVKDAVRASTWGAKITGFEEQGSWAHETIIKPASGKEYDADLLVMVKARDGWTAKDYVNKLATALEADPTYKDKVRRYSHCVTIEYVGERRIDIAPCIVDRLIAGQYEVCNRTDDVFEASEPIAYTQWVRDQNAIAGGNDLKKVTRLLKYLRDIKQTFTCPSFLFTTLLGYRLSPGDTGTAAFSDLPTSLKTLVDRLDDWLQANPTVPVVRNPKLWSEIQSEVWTDDQYSNFRGKMRTYRSWIDDAYDEQDRDESIGKWQRVFGDAFGAGEAKESSRLSEALAKSAVPAVFGSGDLVDQVRRSGASALPPKISKLPYMRRPTWVRASGAPMFAKVQATLYTAKDGNALRSVESLTALKPGYWLKFVAVNQVGGTFPTDIRVMWRVTNTDKAAYDANQLRGDFYDSSPPGSRMEHLQYRGVHMVEAFLIRKSDGRLAGNSKPFYVVIE